MNFERYPALDFVELLVTKTRRLPRERRKSRVSGTPSMTESPRQMTPFEEGLGCWFFVFVFSRVRLKERRKSAEGK